MKRLLLVLVVVVTVVVLSALVGVTVAIVATKEKPGTPGTEGSGITLMPGESMTFVTEFVIPEPLPADKTTTDVLRIALAPSSKPLGQVWFRIRDDPSTMIWFTHPAESEVLPTTTTRDVEWVAIWVGGNNSGHGSSITYKVQTEAGHSWPDNATRCWALTEAMHAEIVALRKRVWECLKGHSWTTAQK